MRKRVLLVLLALAVALAMMPAMTMAGTDQASSSKTGATTKKAVSVEFNMTSNRNNAVYPAAGDKDKQVPGAVSGTYSYDGTTLTLKNVRFKNDGKTGDTDGVFLYASQDLVIDIEGTNVIETSGVWVENNGQDYCSSITSTEGKLTFKGSGSLDVTCSNDSAIIAGGLQVDAGTVSAASDSKIGVQSIGNITVNGGSLYGQGGTGILAGSINVTGGKLEGKSAAVLNKSDGDETMPAIASIDGKITMGSGIGITKPVGGVIGDCDENYFSVPGRGQVKQESGCKTVYEKDGKTVATDVVIESSAKAPAAPTGVTAAAKGTSKIKVSWDNVEGAAGYKLYRATKKAGKYKKIATLTKTSKTVGKLKSNKTYYFKVIAYNSVGTGAASDIASAKTNKVQRPDAFFSLDSSSFLGISAIKVHWNSQPGAIKYQIADNHTKNKKMKVQWTGKNSQNTYWSLWKKSGKTYKYQMRYLSKKKGKKVWSTWTKTVKIKM